MKSHERAIARVKFESHIEPYTFICHPCSYTWPTLHLFNINIYVYMPSRELVCCLSKPSEGFVLAWASSILSCAIRQRSTTSYSRSLHLRTPFRMSEDFPELHTHQAIPLCLSIKSIFSFFCLPNARSRDQTSFIPI